MSLQQLRWPVSSRNGGRLHFGTAADIKSEWLAGLRRISHKPFAMHSIDIWRVENGLFVEHWDELNTLDVFIQIGAVPPPRKPS